MLKHYLIAALRHFRQMPFALSLATTLSIAWLGVAVQSSRAARVNPATVLRYE